MKMNKEVCSFMNTISYIMRSDGYYLLHVSKTILIVIKSLQGIMTINMFILFQVWLLPQMIWFHLPKRNAR